MFSVTHIQLQPSYATTGISKENNAEQEKSNPVGNQIGIFNKIKVIYVHTGG